MDTGEKKDSRPEGVFTARNIFIFLLVCLAAFFIYQLPVFWARPKTAGYVPGDWQGAYLGISSAELKKTRKNLSYYRLNGLLPKNCYYEKKTTGGLFEGAHYTANFYGMVTLLDFSVHYKEQQLNEKKYEYLKAFISCYGPDFKKALWVYTPFTDARYVYQQFIWEKKDARIVLEFSFYENNSKNGYVAKDRGIFLHLGYPGATGENFFNKIIKDQENPELKDNFRLHFSGLEKLPEEMKAEKIKKKP